MTDDHGYSRYSNKENPCRCDICRAAKADYCRQRRKLARENANQWARAGYQHVAEGITHGSRFGYEEHGCRCGPCAEAKRAQWRKEYRARKSRRAS